MRARSILLPHRICSWPSFVPRIYLGSRSCSQEIPKHSGNPAERDMETHASSIRELIEGKSLLQAEEEFNKKFVPYYQESRKEDGSSRRQELTAQLFNEITLAFLDHEEYDTAWNWISQMEKHSVSISPKIFFAVARFYSFSDTHAGVLMVMGEMKRHGLYVSSEIYTLWLLALIRSQEPSIEPLQKALEEKALDALTPDQCRRILIAYSSGTRRMEETETWYQQILKWHPQFGDHHNNNNALAQMLAHRGDLDQSRALVAKLPDPSAPLIEKMVTLYLSQEKEEEATQWLRTLYENKKSQQNFSGGVQVMISHLIAHNRLEEADTLLSSFSESKMLHRCIHVVLEGHVDQGNTERAQVWIRALGQRTLLPFPLQEKLNVAGIDTPSHPQSVLPGKHRQVITDKLQSLFRPDIFETKE